MGAKNRLMRIAKSTLIVKDKIHNIGKLKVK